MHKLSTGIALLAFAGTMAAITPALAVPPMGVQFGFNQNGGIDCALPENANDPYCQQPGKHQHPELAGNGGAGNGSSANDNFDRTNMSHPQGGFSFSPRDRSQFHQDFGFSFGHFATPGFSIRVGVAVPHSYQDLRPVPRKIYRTYPQFRGYLYFVSNRGDFVIVSPRSRHVVAVI